MNRLESAADNSSSFRERLAVAHAALVVVASAWLLGGMGPVGEWIVAALASPSFVLIFSEARARRRTGDLAGFRRLLRWSAPLAALALFTLVSAVNASHRSTFLYNGYVLRPISHVAWLPASANPVGSLRIFACLGGLAATGLALAFCARSRRVLRGLVLFLCLHAVVLAVLGTLQRQSGAAGPFFGKIPAVNQAWFSTFLYHNHWGAFAVLHVAASLALVFHSLKHPPPRGWLHGPGPLIALCSVLVAATAPLSSSRSATVMMLALAALALLAALRRAFASARRRRSRNAALLRVGFVAAFAILGLALVAFQSREVIAARLATTESQLDDLQANKVRYPRSALYADTWRMASDKPVYGWGLESYGRIFLRYSTFRPGRDGLMNTFEDAHSDWLQSLAEIGFVGTALLLLLGLLPLAETLRPGRLSPMSAWLLGGCAIIAAYAWVEFPFACPAVVGTWWILWFAALRTLQLTPVSDSSDSSSAAPRS